MMRLFYWWGSWDSLYGRSLVCVDGEQHPSSYAGGVIDMIAEAAHEGCDVANLEVGHIVKVIDNVDRGT